MTSDDRRYIVASRVMLLSAAAVVGLAHHGVFRALL